MEVKITIQQLTDLQNKINELELLLTCLATSADVDKNGDIILYPTAIDYLSKIIVKCSGKKFDKNNPRPDVYSNIITKYIKFKTGKEDIINE